MSPFRCLARLTALALILAAGTAPTAADPVDASVGITGDLLVGKHDSGTSLQQIFVPVPIVEAEVRASQLMLRLEGLPPLAGTVSDETTRLSILNASLRAFAPGDRFYAGIGQTLYNQETIGGPRAVQPNQDHASRVTGVRFEGGSWLPLRANDRLEFDAAYNPALHGIVHTKVGATGCFAAPADVVPGLICANPAFSVDDPEIATQVDFTVRRVIRSGHSEFVYGLRYLNYAAKYQLHGLPGDGGLADRNVGFLPLVGYRYRF